MEIQDGKFDDLFPQDNPMNDEPFHLDLPQRTMMNKGNYSQCNIEAAKEFEGMTGIKLPGTADAKQLVEFHRDKRLIIPKEMIHRHQQMLRPDQQEFDWYGEQSFDSMIDNGVYETRQRNMKFLGEIRHGKHAIIDKNVKIIQENGHVIVPYKGTEWEKLNQYREAFKNKTLNRKDAASLFKMELQLRPEAKAPLLEMITKRHAARQKDLKLKMKK